MQESYPEPIGEALSYSSQRRAAHLAVHRRPTTLRVRWIAILKRAGVS